MAAPNNNTSPKPLYPHLNLDSQQKEPISHSTYFPNHDLSSTAYKVEGVRPVLAEAYNSTLEQFYQSTRLGNPPHLVSSPLQRRATGIPEQADIKTRSEPQMHNVAATNLKSTSLGTPAHSVPHSHTFRPQPSIGGMHSSQATDMHGQYGVRKMGTEPQMHNVATTNFKSTPYPIEQPYVRGGLDSRKVEQISGTSLFDVRKK